MCIRPTLRDRRIRIIVLRYRERDVRSAAANEDSAEKRFTMAVKRFATECHYFHHEASMTLLFWLLLIGRLSLPVPLEDQMSPPKPFRAQEDQACPPKPIQPNEDMTPPKPITSQEDFPHPPIP